MSALTDVFSNIASAIRTKLGVSTSYTPEQMSEAILSIQTGPDISDATASRDDILTNKTAYIANGKVVGNMTDNGAVSTTINPGNSYTIPAGYHNGSGKVNAKAVNLQSKSTTVTPGASWSTATTNSVSINPDSGYDGMSQVNVSVPMLRDGTIMVPTSLTAPSTIYSGDTAVSNSQQLLRMRPSKDGMSYTGSYLYLQPTDYLGTAPASAVQSGYTFSSSSGIKQTGTFKYSKLITTLSNAGEYFDIGFEPSFLLITTWNSGYTTCYSTCVFDKTVSSTNCFYSRNGVAGIKSLALSLTTGTYPGKYDGYSSGDGISVRGYSSATYNRVIIIAM